MADRRLSVRAEEDLLGIYLFGAERFGRSQAIAYQEELERCFDLLADNPRMGRLAQALGARIRRHEHKSHVILYREDDDHVLILAVLHGSSLLDLDL